MDDTESIKTDELRQFSRVMAFMSASYGSLADWLESKNITEIPGGGTQTAKLGLRYLGGFTGTVLKAYSKSLLGEGEEGPPEIASDLVRAETATKNAAKPRPKPGRRHDPSAPGLTEQELIEKHGEEQASGRKRKGKAGK